MFRWISLAILVVAMAAMATIAVQFLPSPKSEKGSDYPADAGDQVGPPPKAIVDGDLLNEFGAMAQQTTGKKTWTITNAGKGPLTLKKIKTSCSCTIANLKSDKDQVIVEPGGSTTITLEWQTRTNHGPYSQSAEIATNDPERPSLSFETKGYITTSIVTVPGEPIIHLGDVGNEKPNWARFAIYSPDEPDLEIKAVTTSNPDQVVGTARPLTDDERKKSKATPGKAYMIELEVKAGLPIGAIGESLIVKTNHPKQPEYRMELKGQVHGPISAWPARITLTTHMSSKPVNRDVTLWVQGGKSTKFVVAESPAELKVDIKAVDDKAKGDGAATKARTYRMTVTIPANTPPMIINEPIILKTDHPNAAEVKIPIQISIINQG